MATRVINDTKLQDIAVAIQGKDGGGQMTVDEMRGRIEAIPTGSTLIPKTITQNGVYNASSDNADGYDVVTVDVPQNPYEVMSNFIEGTLTRLRLNNVPSGSLQRIRPGSSMSSEAIISINRIELPNNTDNLRSWQFSNLTNLKLFDVGYPKRFENVCIHGTKPLEKLVIRTEDICPYLHSTYMPRTTQIYVNPSLITNYENETNWSVYAGNYHGIYYANSDIEKAALIADSSIPNESMIVCDYNETYYVKGEGVV